MTDEMIKELQWTVTDVVVNIDRVWMMLLDMKMDKEAREVKRKKYEFLKIIKEAKRKYQKGGD
jgi:hypothetical protein